MIRDGFEPMAHIFIEPGAVHIAVQCVAQPSTQRFMIRADRVIELEIVVGKADGGHWPQRDAVFLRIQTDR